MRTLIVVGLLVACGGSSGRAVNPAGTWTLTDTLPTGSTCGVSPPAAETLTIVKGASGYVMNGYSMTATFCETHYCELQGTKDGIVRDVGFYEDNTASGTLTGSGCLYFTAGARAH